MNILYKKAAPVEYENQIENSREIIRHLKSLDQVNIQKQSMESRDGSEEDDDNDSMQKEDKSKKNTRFICFDLEAFSMDKRKADRLSSNYNRFRNGKRNFS
jgi:hypothetical protein